VPLPLLRAREGPPRTSGSAQASPAGSRWVLAVREGQNGASANTARPKKHSRATKRTCWQLLGAPSGAAPLERGGFALRLRERAREGEIGAKTRGSEAEIKGRVRKGKSAPRRELLVARQHRQAQARAAGAGAAARSWATGCRGGDTARAQGDPQERGEHTNAREPTRLWARVGVDTDPEGLQTPRWGRLTQHGQRMRRREIAARRIFERPVLAPQGVFWSEEGSRWGQWGSSTLCERYRRYAPQV
jgi:hypothetical protein